MRWQCVFVSLLFSIAVKSQIITTIAGTGVSGFSGEGGPATNAEFSFLAGVTTDKWGNIYTASVYNNVIQKIDTNGIIWRFAGNGTTGYSGDGGPATSAQLSMYIAVGLAADTTGNVYIACGSTVRRVNTAGIITTVAGTGVYGYSGDGGPATAAQFAAITGLCLDIAGNLYIADAQNSNVRKVNTAGIISTFAGTTIGFSGDGGPATNAQLKTPYGIALDDSGSLYIADGNNFRVRKINLSGIITSIAGGGSSVVSYGFPSSNLQLNGPSGIASDPQGNVYISAIANDVVHKITPSGIAYTIAGTGSPAFGGDGGAATAAQLHSPTMICLDNKGNLLIADKGNIRVRKVWLDGTVHTPPAPTPLPTSAALIISPNPVTQKNISCTVQSDTNENVELVITDVLGKVVTTATCIANTITNISLPVPAGMYFISATTQSGTKMSAKIVVL